MYYEYDAMQRIMNYGKCSLKSWSNREQRRLPWEHGSRPLEHVVRERKGSGNRFTIAVHAHDQS